MSFGSVGKLDCPHTIHATEYFFPEGKTIGRVGVYNHEATLSGLLLFD
jgi:hypothetical protein